ARSPRSALRESADDVADELRVASASPTLSRRPHPPSPFSLTRPVLYRSPVPRMPRQGEGGALLVQSEVQIGRTPPSPWSGTLKSSLRRRMGRTREKGVGGMRSSGPPSPARGPCESIWDGRVRLASVTGTSAELAAVVSKGLSPRPEGR